MSLTLEVAPAITDGGGDLASLVIDYHHQNHGEWTDVEPAKCNHQMCKVADEVTNLTKLLGTDA